MRLENKTCVITAAANGIGKATALAFAENGARVIATDISAEALKFGMLEKGEFDAFSKFFWDGLAVEFAELWLVVEGLELGRAAGHVEVDDAFCFWGVVA